MLRGTEMPKPETRANSLLTRVAVFENRSEMIQKHCLLQEDRRLVHAQMGRTGDVTVALYGELKSGNGKW